MARRDRGAGSVYQRSNGTWSGQIQVDGRRITIYGKTKTEAKERLDQVKRQVIVSGGLPSKHTLFELLEQWYQIGEQTWKPKTKFDYERLSALIKGCLGDIALAKLTPEKLQQFYLGFQHTSRKAQLLHCILHSSLKLAVIWNWIPFNPAEKVVRPKHLSLLQQ